MSDLRALLQKARACIDALWEARQTTSGPEVPADNFTMATVQRLQELRRSIDAALAEPAPEPVVWLVWEPVDGSQSTLHFSDKNYPGAFPVAAMTAISEQTRLKMVVAQRERRKREKNPVADQEPVAEAYSRAPGVEPLVKWLVPFPGHPYLALYAAPPPASPADARNAALEEAARECEKLAELCEQGAGDSPPGHRLRQAARYIRALSAAPRYPKSPII